MEGTKLSVKRMLTRARNALTVFLSKKENTPKEYVSMETLEACFRDGTLTKNKIRGIGKKTISLLETMFPAVEDIKIGGQNMTEKEYNEAEGIRRSDLWKIKESPEKFRYAMEHPPESTPALVFGSACHKMVLEPATFGDEYAVAPNVDGRTKEGKEIKARFAEENAGKTIVSAEDAALMKDMEEAIERCSLANDLLRGDGETETAFFWTDDETEEKCKVKLDRLITGLDGRLYVVDYKTASSADTDAFNRSMMKYGYTLQAAMYTEAVMINGKLPYRPGFIFVVQEKKAPYAINIIQVSPEVMEYGINQFRTLLGKLHTCKELDEWPGYLPVGGGYNYTELPAWADVDEGEE